MIKNALYWFESFEEMPKLLEDTMGFPTSKPCIILGHDKCVWLAYWDGEVWTHANSTELHFNKDYPVIWAYLSIPNI